MEGRLIAFVIWVIIGVLFIVMGIYDFNSKKAKPFGFWANAEVAPIEDVKGYNRALGLKKTEKNGEREIRTLDADYST